MNMHRPASLRARRIRGTWLVCLAIAFPWLHGSSGIAADSATPKFSDEHVEFFEKQVRPLLVAHCYECHSAASKTIMGNLRVDARSLTLQGGDSGAAIVPGKPGDSLLMAALRWESLEMPPRAKLSDKQIAIFEKWIEIGAPWPAASTPVATAETKEWNWRELQASHWAWRPVEKPQIPPVSDSAWGQNPVDRFVLAKLDAAGLKPSRRADRRVLVRRLYLDLIGIAPTPQEVAALVADERPDALAQLVDQLLDSPHYGERWGRLWLDVARYSDGYGGDLDADPLPQAWRYRDWVVQAFNRDLSYDQFIRQQVAGDLMNVPGGHAATGFLALGPVYGTDGGDPDSIAQAKAATLDDRVDTLTRGLLALTVSCARCHDHKFDPIPHLDYYSLAGIFNNTQLDELPLASKVQVDRYRAHEARIKRLETEINDLETAQVRLAEQHRELTPDELQQLNDARMERDRLKETLPAKYEFAHTLADIGHEDMPLAIRGNLLKPGEIAPRRFVRIVTGNDRSRFTSGSGRLELANAIADPRNPLTPRVFVNRVWLQHFGQGLVRTPSNFGKLGQPPTHPELLDWLAATFVESGWSIKQLHRTILLSSTWQMSSDWNEESFSADGDNELLWRQNPRRLDVEAWRDSLLSVTGELDPALGGPPVEQLLSSRRRSIYAKVSRNGDKFESDEFLRLFDFPTPRATSEARPVSIVPQQSLFLLNSEFMIGRATALATRVEKEAFGPRERIGRAYQLLYGRNPTAEEERIGLQFLVARVGEGTSPVAPWVQYMHVLLSANEFMQVR